MSIATLWTSTRTGGTVAHMVASASGLDIDYRFISLRAGEHKTPAFLALNPKGEVPALDVGGGFVITETPAVCTWLADMAPERGLLPAEHPRRAKALEWTAWCHFHLARSFTMIFAANRMAGGDEAVAAVIKAQAAIRSRAALEHADASVQADGSLIGTGVVTVPDIQLFMITNFADAMGIDVGPMAGLQRLRTLVGAHPGVQAALAREAAAGG